MKSMILAVGLLAGMIGSASAQYTYPSYGGYGTGSNPSSTYHQGYTTQSGTYVQPHYQSRSNNTQMDNYGTRGNVNPYTGTYGTRRPRY